MAADSDDEDYIFFGTPIQEETEAKSSAFRKQVLDPGKTRAAPVWDQEPTDEQGRKRFHGAFTGGFSAGYFNTVGSKEGFQPATFRSSRSDRASVKQQTLDDFLDEDERQERGKSTLQVQPEFDTFGFAAAEVARGISQRDADARPSLIPGPAINELIAPVPTSIGVQLLHKMGWRGGRGITQAPTMPGEDLARKSKWGSVAGVSLDNTPLYVLEPKQDVHGLGFDPFSGAEDFRQLKKQRVEQQQRGLQQAAADATSKLGMGGGRWQQGGGAGGKKRPRGLPFGGFTEDSGMYGYVEDYADEDEEDGAGQRPTKMSVLTGGGLKGYSFELMGSESDDEGPAGRGRRPLLLGDSDRDAPLMLESAEHLRRGGDFIPGFKKSDEQVVIPSYPPPEVPPPWVPHHVFPDMDYSKQQEMLPPPPEVPPPEDQELRKQIDSLAAMVARTGAAVEVLARKQAQAAAQQQHHQQDPSQRGYRHFEFLLGGVGATYYTWRLYKIKAALSVLSGTGIGSAGPAGQQAAPQTGRVPLSVDQRMAMLGEEALPSFAEAQQALATAQGLAGVAPPVKAVAEGDKQRLKEALNSMFVKAEQLDMGLAPDTQVGLRQGGKASQAADGSGPVPAAPLGAAGSSTAATVLAGLGNRFQSSGATETLGIESRGVGLLQGTSGGLVSKVQGGGGSAKKAERAAAAALQPKRWFEDWRPDPVVCKRFNVPDPYKGKAAAPQMPKFRTEYLSLPETALGLHQGDGAPGGQQQQGEVLPPPPPLPINIQDAVARAAAIAQKLSGLPSGGPAVAAATQEQLPGPPPLYPPPPPLPPGGGVPHSSGIPAVQTDQVDAKTFAASFLDSLTGGGGVDVVLGGAAQQPAAAVAAGVAVQQEGPGQMDGGVAGGDQAGGRGLDELHVPEAGASADFPTMDRPLDIFKAIFEAEDDDDEEEQEQEAAGAVQGGGQAVGPVVEPGGGGGGGGGGGAVQLGPQPAGVVEAAAQPAPPVAATPQQAGLAAALMKAQQVAAEKAAADVAARQAQAAAQAQQQQAAAGAQGTGVGAGAGAGVVPAQQVDPEVQQRILAALKLIKKGKKEKKDKSKKSKKKHKHSSKKESSSKPKSKHRSSKSKHKTSKRGGSREAKPSSDSDGSENASGSDSEASSSSSG